MICRQAIRRKLFLQKFRKNWLVWLMWIHELMIMILLLINAIEACLQIFATTSLSPYINKYLAICYSIAIHYYIFFLDFMKYSWKNILFRVKKAMDGTNQLFSLNKKEANNSNMTGLILSIMNYSRFWIFLF